MRCSCQKRRYFASGGPKPEVFHHLTGNVVAQWRFVVAPKGQSEKDAHLTVVREAAFICRYPSRRVIRLAAAATGMADEDLIQAGADVNATNDASMTVLTLLSQRGRPDEIATLLRAGADGRRKDAAGRTALDYLNAANCGRPIVTKRDPPGMMEGVATYSRCNALRDDYFKSKQLLIDAGARATRVSTPNRPK